MTLKSPKENAPASPKVPGRIPTPKRHLLPRRIVNGASRPSVAARRAAAEGTAYAAALWAAVLSGGVNDALSMHPWGTHALGYVVVLWFVVRMRTKIDGADRYATLLVVILAASLNEAISCSVLFIEGGRAALVGWEWTLMTVGYKSALAFVVTALIKPFRHALAGRRLGALYRF